MQFRTRAIFLRASVMLASVIFFNAAYAQPLITFDSATGNYNFIYQKQNGSGAATGVFIPGSKFVFPSARSTFTLSGVDTLVYRYAVANASTATSAIYHVYFDDAIIRPLVGEVLEIPNESVVQVVARFAVMPNVVLAPPAWKSRIDRDVTNSGVPTSRVVWTGGEIGILPGAEVAGLGFSSLDLPGLASLTAEGGTDMDYPDPDGPGENDPVDRQLWDIKDATYPTVNAAAPMIAVPSPFDPAVTLENIQAHIHSWIAKQLLDTAFSAQLDTSFQAAIAAYRANQPQTAITQLQTMRMLIKQQQPDADKNDTTPTVNLPAPPATIDLLTARILYFDLGYVMQR